VLLGRKRVNRSEQIPGPSRALTSMTGPTDVEVEGLEAFELRIESGDLDE